MPASRKGFIPVRTLHGGPMVTHQYPVSAAPATSLFINDLCCKLAGGSDGGGVVQYTTANAPRILGVVARCLNSDRRELTFSLPTRGPYIQATAGAAVQYVDVYDDPDMVYRVTCVNSAGPSNFNQFLEVATISAGNQGNTASGISRMSATLFTTAGTGLMCLGLADTELTRLGASANEVEVVIATHINLTRR